MKIPRERFFVLITYDLLLRHLVLVAKARINCSIYFKAIDSYAKEEMNLIKSFFTRNKLLSITHGPFLDLNPGSLDKKIRQVSFERLVETLEISKLIGSRHITFHSGFRPDPYSKYKDTWLENSIATWKAFIKTAEKKRIKVTIENAFEKTPELLIELVKQVNSPNFNLCFDAGHFNAFSDVSPLEAFDMLPADKVGEIHLSDNNGSDDQHLPLGEGNIDLDALFKRIEKLKIEPIFTLEPNDINDAEKSIRYLQDKNII